jgi:glycerate-2-kinase
MERPGSTPSPATPMASTARRRLRGALIGPDTLTKARAAGLDASHALSANDAHSFFAGIDGQVVTGPTLTNVNDFRAILIAPPT